MNRVFNKSCIAAALLSLLLAACSPRIYRPPALGAEYRFDEGLKPRKPEQRLFNKKMDQYLQKKGIQQKDDRASKTVPAVAQKDSIIQSATVSGSSHNHAATTPAPPSSPASPDSSHTVSH